LISSGVPRRARFFTLLTAWLPVLLWMLLIYGGSADWRSVQRSSRIIGPLLRWLKPDISEATVSQVVFVARKGAHITEYAVLALLIWRALRLLGPAHWPAWSGRRAALCVGLAGLYAGSDELHQLFVPNRQGHLGDVLLDTFGAALAMLFVWLFGRWRARGQAP
jgi:VanZ family protein